MRGTAVRPAEAVQAERKTPPPGTHPARRGRKQRPGPRPPRSRKNHRPLRGRGKGEGASGPAGTGGAGGEKDPSPRPSPCREREQTAARPLPPPAAEETLAPSGGEGRVRGPVVRLAQAVQAERKTPPPGTHPARRGRKQRPGPRPPRSREYPRPLSGRGKGEGDGGAAGRGAASAAPATTETLAPFRDEGWVRGAVELFAGLAAGLVEVYQPDDVRGVHAAERAVAVA